MDTNLQGQSKVGYVTNMHGKQFNISVTNASAYEMLSFNTSTNFQGSSLFISSPTTANWFDKGTPALLVSDNDGKLLRLTYTFKPGNGLIYDETNKDVLCIGIDKHTINTNDKGKLFVTPSNLILHTDTLETKSYNGIDYISIKTSGIIDNQSIKSYFKYIPDKNGGKHNFDLINYANEFPLYSESLYVNNKFLVDNHFLTTIGVENKELKNYIINNCGTGISNDLKIDEMGDLYGSYCTKLSANLSNMIDNNTLVCNVVSRNFDESKNLYYTYKDGEYSRISTYNVISVDTQKLQKATNNIYGTVKGETSGENSVSISNGKLSVNTQLLTKGTNSHYGVVKVDDNTVKSNAGTLSVETQNLTKSSESKFGVVKVDNTTIKSNNGLISVDTQGLYKTDDKFYGVIKLDNKTLNTNQTGHTFVNTANLVKSNESQYGIVKPDNSTIKSNSGILSVITSGLEHASANKYGTVKVDNNTIKVVNPSGSDVIRVETSNLTKASSVNWGVVKIDDYTITINNEKLQVSNELRNRINEMEIRIRELEGLVGNLQGGIITNSVRVSIDEFYASTIDPDDGTISRDNSIFPSIDNIPFVCESGFIGGDKDSKTLYALLCKYSININNSPYDDPIKVYFNYSMDKNYSYWDWITTDDNALINSVKLILNENINDIHNSGRDNCFFIQKSGKFGIALNYIIYTTDELRFLQNSIPNTSYSYTTSTEVPESVEHFINRVFDCDQKIRIEICRCDDDTVLTQFDVSVQFFKKGTGSAPFNADMCDDIYKYSYIYSM